jgi:dynein light intermediate chain 1
MASPASSRSNSPPPQDLWSSILDSVSSSRATPSKNVVVLGEPQSGKSTLVQHLLQKKDNNDVNGKDADFALGYDWADVRDEGDEGIYYKTGFVRVRLTLYTRHTRSTVGLYCTFFGPSASITTSALSPSQNKSHKHTCHNHLGLDQTLEFRGPARDLDGVGQYLG